MAAHTIGVSDEITRRGRLTAAAIARRLLRAVVAATLTVDAYVHFHDAHFYDFATTAISQGTLFRVQAGLAAAVAIALVASPRPAVWALALLVTASAAAAVVLYTYVDIGAIGPLANMYEPSWHPPGKLASASFETAGALLALIGLILSVRARRTPSEGLRHQRDLPGRRPLSLAPEQDT